MTDKMAAWLCLKSAPGLKFKAALDLLGSYPDPVAFVGRKDHPLYQDKMIDPAIRQHLLTATPHPRQEQISKLCEHYGIDILCLGEDEYPLGLASIATPPLVLYYRGNLRGALKQICLAVVGTRKTTAYGRESCAKLLAPACRRGITVVSGLASGIDTVAHGVALKHGSKTIAVLASGVDTIYPRSNFELAGEIIKHGALVSEYEPGTKVDAWNFPARNRIISALAETTFIVEGPLTSGAMLTAKFALEQNRDIMALPGEINHPNAQGPNYLIKNGAQCVTCPEDILSSLGLDTETREQLEIMPPISADEQAVFDFFKSEQRELSFDELLLNTGHSFGKLSTILLNLELKGYLAKTGGNSYILG
jgi:DNA processing protein